MSGFSIFHFLKKDFQTVATILGGVGETVMDTKKLASWLPLPLNGDEHLAGDVGGNRQSGRRWTWPSPIGENTPYPAFCQTDDLAPASTFESTICLIYQNGICRSHLMSCKTDDARSDNRSLDTQVFISSPSLCHLYWRVVPVIFLVHIQWNNRTSRVFQYHLADENFFPFWSSGVSGVTYITPTVEPSHRMMVTLSAMATSLRHNVDDILSALLVHTCLLTNGQTGRILIVTFSN